MSTNYNSEIIEEKEPSVRLVNHFQNVRDKTLKYFSKRFKNTNWSENSLDISIVVLLIVFALFVRILLSYTFREEWGYGSDNIWDRSVIFNIEGITIRGFADFGYYYKSWIIGWYEGTWYPYQWHEPANVLDFYSYPPVFIYFLVLTWRPGMSNFWMAFPMILADAACAGVVYLIIKNLFKKERGRQVAILGGILMAIAPINVVYDGIYWLNPGPVTLLTIIAFYFAIKKKWWQAFFWLAIATMTKQNALFFTYPLFFAMLGEKVKNKTIKEAVIESIGNALLYVVVGLTLSLPWVSLSPYEYLRHMMFPGRPIELRFTPVDPVANDCVSFAKSLQEVGLPAWIVAIASFGNYSMLWMILLCSGIVVYMCWREYKGKMDGVEFFEWIAVYTIVSHIMMPRGVYKFYSAYYVPMLLIALLGSFAKLTSKRKFLPIGLLVGSTIFLGFNFWHFTLPRFSVPFFLGMVALFICLLSWIRGYLRDESKMRFILKVHNYLKGGIGSK
ncbi:MAG: glycosyltransferase family 39 protein [Candidatus Thorarchaeota archaeon]